MKTFTFKESLIRKSALSNDSSWSDMRKELSGLNDLVNALAKERSARLQEEERLRKIQELKSVEVGGKIYLTSNNWKEVPYGTEITKVADKRKYMTCETEVGKFNVPYSWLSVVKPDESTISANRGLRKIFEGL